ncbi:MAG: glycosyltransferase family 4 protein, partial [Lachnospiraceae bacterium]|nr:glycosyltransferase family 4 protein [Lachnospiraceae bacterium]
DVFAVPSVTAKDKDKEGFGLVILEAMASGLPVVASESGGIAEIIRHEENGLLSAERDSVRLADNINRMLKDEKLRRKIICNMNATVRLYDYEAVGKRYAELMQW